MSEESTLLLRLLGALRLVGRELLEGIRTSGFSACGLRPPAWDELEQPQPGLTLAEELTWSGLQWRLGRQRRRPGAADQALLRRRCRAKKKTRASIQVLRL